MKGVVLTMSSAEAVWGMIILSVLLVIVLFFFCCMPVYRALQERYTHWDDPENDPRWNSDHYQFSPTSPQLGPKNKYNRLSVCSNQTVSRGSSFRNQCILPRLDDQVEIKMPPAYTDLYEPGSVSLGSPPAYYSRTPSDTDEADKSDQLNQEPNPASPAGATGPSIVVTEAPPNTKKSYKKAKKPKVVTSDQLTMEPNKTLSADGPSQKPNQTPPADAAIVIAAAIPTASPANPRKTYKKIKKPKVEK